MSIFKSGYKVLQAAADGDSRFLDDDMNNYTPEKVMRNLSGTGGHSSDADRLKCMKWILGQISKGKDMSQFIAPIVNLVVSNNLELKKFVYMYLVHYADYNAECRQVALMSTNTFRKDTESRNIFIRGLALRVLTSIRIKDILQIQTMIVKKCLYDPSSYVRSVCCHSLSKLYNMDPSLSETISEYLGQLIAHNDPVVLSHALATFDELFPNKFEMIHQHYRRILGKLIEMDEWGQITAVNILLRYAKKHFPAAKPNISAPNESKQSLLSTPSETPSNSKLKADLNEFYSNDGSEKIQILKTPQTPNADESKKESIFEVVENDRMLLLSTTLPLLQSRNASLVLSVSILHYYIGTPGSSGQALVSKALIRILTKDPPMQYVVLSTILEMIKNRPHMFDGYFEDLLLCDIDPLYVKKLKLDILYHLVNEENINILLTDLEHFLLSTEVHFVSYSITILGYCVLKIPTVLERVLRGLVSLVHIREDDETIVGHCITVIRQLLSTLGAHKEILYHLMFNIDKLTAPNARSSLVSLFSIFYNDIVEFVPDCLRILAKNFPQEEPIVKMQIINFAFQAAFYSPKNTHIKKIKEYLIKLGTLDDNLDIRARVESLISLSQWNNDITKQIFTCPIPIASSEPPSIPSQYTLGSLSYFIGHPANGFSFLPESPETELCTELRDPAYYEKKGLPEGPGSGSDSYYSDSYYSGSRSRSYSGSRSRSPSYSRSRSGSYSRSYSGSRSHSPYSGSPSPPPQTKQQTEDKNDNTQSEPQPQQKSTQPPKPNTETNKPINKTTKPTPTPAPTTNTVTETTNKGAAPATSTSSTAKSSSANNNTATITTTTKVTTVKSTSSSIKPQTTTTTTSSTVTQKGVSKLPPGKPQNTQPADDDDEEYDSDEYTDETDED